MKTHLNRREAIALASMLFGMFFGAGNLIFPALLGRDAGSNFWPAFAGMLITAVGLPLLAVASLAISRSNSVLDLAGKVSKPYGVFFALLLYLTIGPCFAIPRCASTAFAVGSVNLIPTENQTLALAFFSMLFFSVVLFFSMQPNGIMTWIGRILNPLFLVFLAVLVVAAIGNPINAVSAVTPSKEYATFGNAFVNGVLEGYNTLDALAGLAFGMVVVNVIRRQGIEDPVSVASNTARSGVFSCLFMGLIYFFITYISATSASVCSECENGGAVLGLMSDYYFGTFGAVLIAAIVTFACLKTAIGLVTSCSEVFCKLFPKGPSYPVWCTLFCMFSFGVANLGLSSIVAYCVPILMFLYPLAITLILLALFGRAFRHDRAVYVATTVAALVSALFDFAAALASTLKGSGVAATPILDAISGFASHVLPLFNYGLGWLVPSVLGFVVGMILHLVRRKKQIVA